MESLLLKDVADWHLDSHSDPQIENRFVFHTVFHQAPGGKRVLGTRLGFLESNLIFLQRQLPCHRDGSWSGTLAPCNVGAEGLIERHIIFRAQLVWSPTCPRRGSDSPVEGLFPRGRRDQKRCHSWTFSCRISLRRALIGLGAQGVRPSTWCAKWFSHPVVWRSVRPKGPVAGWASLQKDTEPRGLCWLLCC